MIMQTKWQSVKLGKLAKFRNGINYNKNNFGKGLKVINVKDFQDYSFVTFDALEEINPDGLIREDNFLKKNDIIFVRSNGNRQLIGRSLFVRSCPERISHSAFSIKLRFDSEEVYPLFYAYLFRTSLIRETLSSQGNGTNISNLNQEILSNLEVPLPPLSTQRKIAGILSAYDDLIENNTRRIEILEEMARMLYREWFVKFRFPVGDGEDGGNGGGDRPSDGVGNNGGDRAIELVESELGLIPKGWEVKNLFDIADVTYGYPFKSKQFNQEQIGIGTIRIRDIKNEEIQTYTTEKVDDKYLVKSGDILVGMDGDFHMGKWANEPAYLVQRVARFRPSIDISKYYLFLSLQEPIKYFNSTITGTTVAHLGDKHLKTIKILVPSQKICDLMKNSFDPIFEQEINLRFKNINLRKTRDLLLPRLISGEIDVEELDINLGAMND